MRTDRASTITEPLLDAADEVDLARRIEAGLIAEQVLARRWPHPVQATGAELEMLVSQGQAAWQRMWLANLGLVRMLTYREGRAHRAPGDDLMQEGCLGLAQAIMRWDHRRGTRFSTVAWPWIENRLRRFVRDHERGSSWGPDVPEVADPHTLNLSLTRDSLPVWLATPSGPEREVLVHLARGEDRTAREWAERWGVSTSTARRIKMAAVRSAREAWQRSRVA